MTDRDEIIRMALEAKFDSTDFRWVAYSDGLERFYRAAFAAGAAAEREACAKVCDERITHEPGMQREDYENRQCAAAIRARGNV